MDAIGSPPVIDPTSTPAWLALTEHAHRCRSLSVRGLLDEPRDHLRLRAAGIGFDYSRQRVDDEAVRLLVQLARETGVEALRAAMFGGEHINVTEDRAALHTALRLPLSASLEVDGQDVVADVHGVLQRMSDFAEEVRTG
jgi:Glucose-6-phosphate isomerase